MRPRFDLPQSVGALTLIAVLATLTGCDDKSAGQDPAASASIATPPPSVSSAPAASASATEQDTAPAPMELQELTFTSEVKAKEPVDTLLAAEPGKRVWAHLRIRYRGDQTRNVHLEFRVNDQKRTTLDLKITKSWSYRTWAFNTLLDSDKTGKVSLTVTDDEGTVLADTSVPIAAKMRTKPYVKKTN